ncbi:hypothetical protein ACHAXA_002507 [Cyclostephanos tholiformis]|uniref:SUZ domain-containing protein n=1 Tax=Cyclostephanos tholiformis TaxID=382380 RepID=A0ABD3SD79_9STRA
MVWNPLEEVDSALLSALCDPRERKALLRLEQIMVDFINDKSSGSMEVGGAFNAIALNQNVVDDGSQNCYGEAASDGQLHVVSQQGHQEFLYQQQRGLRQTSFQRLILHRLADRFNIFREQILHPNVGAGNRNERGLLDMGMGAQQFFSPGLIRLVKMNESSVPTHLLIDIDLSLLINYKNPRARNYYGGGITSNVATDIFDDGARNITENMASATLKTQTSVAMSSSKKTKKMVIMKRDSSGEGGGDLEGSGKGKQNGKSRKKKLEDREKAYEEARARIFGLSESSGKENTDDGDDNAEKSEAGHCVPQSHNSHAITPASPNLSNSFFSAEGDVINPVTSSNAAEVDLSRHMVPSQLISAATLTSDHSSPSTSDLDRDSGPNSTPSRVASSEADTLRQPSVPAAVTGAAVSKAVYRNRLQEENDPDFRRRSDVRPAYVPYVGNLYGGPNPYLAMGQQLHSPQLIAMHMQQQAQQPPHFYQGQQQQYPTPQDAAYTANVANNPQMQWISHPRGYYPPPLQQKVQENHTQTWSARPNSSLNPNSCAYPAHISTTPTDVVSNPQTQLSKTLWGPGAKGGTSYSDTSPTSATSEGAPTPGEEEDAGVCKAEDFPALR